MGSRVDRGTRAKAIDVEPGTIASDGRSNVTFYLSVSIERVLEGVFNPNLLRIGSLRERIDRGFGL